MLLGGTAEVGQKNVALVQWLRSLLVHILHTFCEEISTKVIASIVIKELSLTASESTCLVLVHFTKIPVVMVKVYYFQWRVFELESTFLTFTRQAKSCMHPKTRTVFPFPRVLEHQKLFSQCSSNNREFTHLQTKARVKTRRTKTMWLAILI